MLDERVTTFVHEAVRVRAREFEEDLAMRLLELDSKAARAGALSGSGRINAYAHEFRQELRNRAQYIYLEMQRALGLYPQTASDALQGDLIGLHITEVRSQCTELQRLLEKRLGGGGAFGEQGPGPLYTQLNDQCDHLRDKYTLEIRAFLEAAAQRVRPASDGASGVVIHGNVGVVQTGAYATAALTVNVGADDRAAMLKALELVGQTFRDAAQLAEEHRRQMLETIEEARRFTQVDRPNASLLRGVFTVLCETLQTVAASGPALAALRAAALPFGISL